MRYDSGQQTAVAPRRMRATESVHGGEIKLGVSDITKAWPKELDLVARVDGSAWNATSRGPIARKRRPMLVRVRSG